MSFDARDPTQTATRATVRQAGEIEALGEGVARCVSAARPGSIRPRPLDLRERRAIGPRGSSPTLTPVLPKPSRINAQVRRRAMAHEERRGPRARRRGHPRPLRRRRPALRRPRRETCRAPLHPGDARRRRGVLLQLSRHAQVHRRPRDALRQGGRHRLPPATRRRDRRRVRAPRSRSESRGRIGHDGGGHLPAQGRRERAGFRRGRRHRQVRVGRRLEGGHVPRRRAVLARRPVQGS